MWERLLSFYSFAATSLGIVYRSVSLIGYMGRRTRDTSMVGAMGRRTRASRRHEKGGEGKSVSGRRERQRSKGNSGKKRTKGQRADRERQTETKGRMQSETEKDTEKGLGVDGENKRNPSLPPRRSTEWFYRWNWSGLTSFFRRLALAFGLTRNTTAAC